MGRQSDFGHRRLQVFAHIGILILLGCSGTKLREQPVTVEIVESLVTASDEYLDVFLDWVIVNEGPGSWAHNVDWDEYLLRITNNSDVSARLTDVAVYDSQGFRLETSGRRPDLVRNSKETKRRYGEQGLQVNAGIGSATLVAAGGIAVAGGTVAAMSAMTPYGIVAGGTAAAATAAIIVAPVLIAGGVMEGMNEAKVERELINRQSGLPLLIRSGENQFLHFFFPLAPSPSRVELTYMLSGQESVISLDTCEPLFGLHIGTDGTNSECKARVARQ